MYHQWILVVDDEAALRTLISGVLEERGRTVEVRGSAEGLLDTIQEVTQASVRSPIG